MSSQKLSRDFFLWCMSVIYLFAFSSIYLQIPGLYGDNGLLPARLVLRKEAESFSDLVSVQPTLLRLLPKLGLDAASGLDFLTLSGIVLSFVAMICKHQRNSIIFAALWLFYLSIFQVGQTFLWFQWDILLMEVGFLTILVAPLNLLGFRAGSAIACHHQHDVITLWLVKWLLFRLMFASGVVKLTSNCPTWWGLTALNYHYETQCIPTPIAWYLHQAPEWFQKLSVVIVYVIEIAVPFLFFSPARSQRLFAFCSQVLLQLLIIVSGNYNFFNLLTVALCVPLLDDVMIGQLTGRKRKESAENKTSSLPQFVETLNSIGKLAFNFIVFGAMLYFTVRIFAITFNLNPLQVDSAIVFKSDGLAKFLQIIVPVSMWLGAASLSWEVFKACLRSFTDEKGFLAKIYSLGGVLTFGLIACLMFSVSLVDHTVVERESSTSLWPLVHRWHGNAQKLQLTSSYGLFRMMTGVGGRPEVIIEGSNSLTDGWKEYNFLYKPGNVSTILPFVAPHQPRLDWQMWFAALGSYQQNPWFLNLIYRLHCGQHEVLELMGENPFPNAPPKYIRATLYHYHFTRAESSSSNWWKRKFVREYLPPITKDEESFARYVQQAGLVQHKVSQSEAAEGLLARLLALVRSLIGQANGFRTCMTLFITGLVLTVVDPSMKLAV